MSPLIFLVLGFILIFIEFYLPGALMGIIGGICILASFSMFARQTESFLLFILYVMGSGVALAFLIKFVLWRIRTEKPQHSIYSADTQDGYRAVDYDASTIGKSAVVLTDLKPGGFIIVEGKQQPAISQEGYLAKGTKVLVISGNESNLIVRKE
ncbi:NfeD family protein [Neochlamydia sp. AcF95]|uniref:NfeD family protein n=1 Tax=Neochlamydia sp. AcF95 TaxID=2795734 RepID=UPI001BC9FC6D|nr:NfeD family protein [Neochlamydia sp. AcF95]MBS4170841.1 Uncharacterized protein [Neochlamydia sp. AcF95]